MSETQLPKENNIVRRIAQNGVVAALYYGLTMLFILVPVISQFGPIQCRFSEILVLFAFFKPELTIGLTIGCFLSNMTGFLVGQGFALDMVFGTAATLIACLLEAYASRFLFIAALWPVVLNGVIVGAEIYFLFNLDNLPIWACMGWVALGELIVMVVGYLLFFFLKRNGAFMRLIGATRHLDVKC